MVKQSVFCYWEVRHMPHLQRLENSAAAILVGVSAITLAAIYHVDETIEFHQLYLVGHDMILASTVDNGK